MCGFCCNGLIECVLAGKTLSEYTNLFSQSDNKNNDKIRYKYFNYKFLKYQVQIKNRWNKKLSHRRKKT